MLHRCVLAVPVGGPLRDRALAELATLSEAGLDPLLLGASKTARPVPDQGPDRGRRPTSSRSPSTATPQPAKSFPLITEKLGEADLRRALIACWEQYSAASKKASMTATLGFKAGYIPAEYEDEPGRYVVKAEPAVALPPGPRRPPRPACGRSSSPR